MASSGAAFSYAQAAKGLAPSTQSSPNAPSSTTSEQGAKEAPSNIETVHLSEPSKVEIDSNKSQAQTASRATSSDQGKAADANKVRQNNNPTAPQLSSSTTSASGISVNEDGQADVTSDKLNKPDQPLIVSDSDKAKETEDEWEKVSIPSVTAEKELKAAPIPSVNIWQQRKEAQAAKQKDSTPQRPPQSTPVPKPRAAPPVSVDDTKRRTNNRDAEKPEHTPPKRVDSGHRSIADRKDSTQVSPRASVQQISKEGSALQSTTDAEAWPTPDSTTAEERRRSIVHDKSEKPDVKNNNQKKWVQMPFVPSAKFETQLPPAAARRGGRPANRGRDSTGRGAFVNTSNNERPEVGSMGPPPLPNKGADQERGRKNTGQQTSRASSVPTQGNRASSTDETARGPPPRLSLANTRDAGDSSKVLQTSNHKGSVVGTDEAQPGNVSRSSSRHNNVQHAQRKTDSDRKSSATLASQGQSPVEPTSRGVPGERYRGSFQDGGRASIDGSERSFGPGREWSRSRTDPSREKNESWRGREPRSERGRGGFRGRGNHTGFNHASPSSYTAPIPQNGFEPLKAGNSHESRNRQASQPYAQTQPSGNNRNNPRSQSIPISMVQSSYYAPVQGFPQTMSPTEVNFGQYPQQMHGGIMSAMPYADQLNSYALISMVITQLEYYFSIDNLCKDMFLRKNMDSQGYVPLGVIASFKRIKALTDGQMTHDQLRTVCQQVRNVEFVTSEGGEDKLRSRENWRDFVLPMDERLPIAQNEGPSIRSAAPPAYAPAEFPNQNGPLRSAPPNINGFAETFNQAMQPMGYPPIAPFDGSTDFNVNRADSQATDAIRRTSTTSPFSNAQSPAAPEHTRSPSSYMNGHHHSVSAIVLGENAFPDEKIPELKVVVRDPAFEANLAGEIVEQSAKPGIPALRGGAGSPDKAEHFRNIQFGQAALSTSSSDSEQPPYWTKDGEVAKIPTGPGFVHEDYLPLRDKALAQRMDDHLDGALRVLYAFWSSFLVEHFNLSMYEEFASLANEDLQAGNETGKTYLLKYYESLLTSKAVMSERIATDIVAMAREEKGDTRPTWQKLRSAWRNGATNMKTRKRLGDVLNSEEKADLDRTV